MGWAGVGGGLVSSKEGSSEIQIKPVFFLWKEQEGGVASGFVWRITSTRLTQLAF